MDRVKKLEKRLESIRYIGNVLSRTLNIDDLLTLIIDEMTKLMNAERSTLFVVDRKHNEIWSKIAQKSEIREIRQEIGKGLSGWVAEHGEMINIEDVADDDRFDSTTDKKTGFHTTSALTCPIFRPSLKTSGKRTVIAVIQVLNKKTGDPFDADDETLIESLASQISISLMNAMLYSQLNNKVKELDFLFDIEKKVSTSFDMDQLLNDLIERLIYYLEAEAGSIVLRNDEKKSLFFKVATGAHSSFLKSLELDEDHGVVGWVIQNKTSVRIDDVNTDERFNEEIAEETKLYPVSIICVPLLSNNEAIGAIELLNKTSSSKIFGPDDLQVLELISGQITRILQTINAREAQIKEDRMVAIGNMVSTIVHDIRAPMGNIYGFVDLMQDDGVSQSEREEYAEIVLNQINNLVSMSNEILDFAKGKTTSLPRKVSVNKIFDSYVKLVSLDLEKRNIEFIAEKNFDSALINADYNKIIRIFLNLQKNAIEAIKSKKKKLVFSVNRVDDEIQFSFTDNGPGIPEEIKSTLFESFVTSGKEHGTGLGLAIVKRIIDDHNGRIQVDSNSKGSTFTLCFKEIID